MEGKYGGYEEVEFVAEHYDIAYDHLRTRDIDFFIDYSGNTGGRTLELGCGTGRILIPVAAAGYEITGLELSPYMLAICREKLNRQPADVRKRVKLTQGNMVSFDTGETYSLITVPFRAFQHLLYVEEQKACLGCVHKHLAPDGLFILDLFNPRYDRLYQTKYEEETEDMPETEMPDGRRISRANRVAGFHRDRQYNDIEIIYYVSHPDGRKERLVQSFPMRYYFRYEIEHLLELCGFGVVDLFGNHDGSAYSVNSPEMIFVVGKK